MQMRAEEIYLHVPVSPPPEPLTSIESVATQANTSSTSAPRSLTGQGSLFSSIFQTSAMPQTNFGLSNNRSDNDEELRKDKQKNEEHLAKIISYDDDIQRRLSRFEHSNWKAVSLDLYNSKTPCASARELALLQFVRDLQLTRSQLMHHKIVCDPEDIDYPFKDKKYKYKGRACSHKDCTEKKRQATLCKHHFHKFRCLGKHTLVFC